MDNNIRKALTDERLNELICGKKIITTKPKKVFSADKTSHLFVHNSFECELVNQPNEKFHVFMKKHCTIPDKFSIGLIYLNTNVLLIRVNGKHYHFNKDDSTSFNDFHIHKASELQLKQGITNSYHAEISNEYTNFDSALLHFCQICNIIDAGKFFPKSTQISFLED